jgi:CDGSH-type Zn-finger protein
LLKASLRIAMADYFCGGKHSGKKPLCDGVHAKLQAAAETPQKRKAPRLSYFAMSVALSV